MARLAFWHAPKDKNVDRVEVWRSTSSDMSAPVRVDAIDAKDVYRNWVTHYNDTATSTTAYYQAKFYKRGVYVSSWPAGSGYLGVEPYQVTPQDVLDTLQGVPAEYVRAEIIQRYITAYVKAFETYTGMRLSATTATRERYGSKVYDKLLGEGAGGYIQLRHWPIISLDTFEYQVRGGSVSGPSDPVEITGIDAQIEYHDPSTGYNRGIITGFITRANVEALFALYQYRAHRKHRVQILISYTHGYATWPADIQQAIIEMATASILEIMGEAVAGGLSSRSIDGYSESFTASATTTVFSARRIWYEKGFGSLLERYKKPLWG